MITTLDYELRYLTYIACVLFFNFYSIIWERPSLESRLGRILF